MTTISLVTGASRGLGRNTAEHLAARGIDVIGTYHSKAEEAQAVAARLEQAGVKATMLQPVSYTHLTLPTSDLV